MISDDLFNRIAALAETDLEALRITVASRLQDEQLRFARGELTELELIAYTRAANRVLGALPVTPGMSRSRVETINSKLVEETDEALAERAREL